MSTSVHLLVICPFPTLPLSSQMVIVLASYSVGPRPLPFIPLIAGSVGTRPGQGDWTAGAYRERRAAGPRSGEAMGQLGVRVGGWLSAAGPVTPLRHSAESAVINGQAAPPVPPSTRV